MNLRPTSRAPIRGGSGFEVSHPSDKNRDVARTEHPAKANAGPSTALGMTALWSGSRYPRSPGARDLHRTDEDLSVGTPKLGHPVLCDLGLRESQVQFPIRIRLHRNLRPGRALDCARDGRALIELVVFQAMLPEWRYSRFCTSLVMKLAE